MQMMELHAARMRPRRTEAHARERRGRERRAHERELDPALLEVRSARRWGSRTTGRNALILNSGKRTSVLPRSPARAHPVWTLESHIYGIGLRRGYPNYLRQRRWLGGRRHAPVSDDQPNSICRRQGGGSRSPTSVVASWFWRSMIESSCKPTRHVFRAAIAGNKKSVRLENPADSERHDSATAE